MKIESPPAFVVGASERGTSAGPERADAAVDARASRSTQESSAASVEEKGRAKVDELARNLVSAADLPEFRNYELSFRVDRDLQRVIVQVLDSETKEVVRSIPPEDVIRSLKRLHENSRGILVDQEG